LVPNYFSKPSLVVCFGLYITPALLISRSTRGPQRRRGGPDGVERGQVHPLRTVTLPVVLAAACSAFSTLRMASRHNMVWCLA
jgi:hypothetical protein